MSKAQRKLERLQTDLFDLAHRDDAYVIASTMTREQLQEQVTAAIEHLYGDAPGKVRRMLPLIVSSVFDALELAADLELSTEDEPPTETVWRDVGHGAVML